MSTTLDLLPQHAQQLTESGISNEVAAARGYASVMTKAAVRQLGFGVAQCNVPALLIPIWGVTGEIVNYHLRPDTPRVKDGKALKYEMPQGSRMVLDIHPFVRPVLGDPSVRMLITEGSKKVDAAVSRTLQCIGLPGVWGFRGRNAFGATSVLGDWESVALKHREVCVVFDSDVARKPEVYAALVRFVAFLRSRGARVTIAYLPHGDDGRKCGLDDFLAAHPVDDLWQYLENDLREPPRDAADITGPYAVRDNRLFHVRRVGEGGHEYVPLTNFVAKIVEEVIADDGASERGELLLDGVLANGRTLALIRVPLTQFAAMNWPTALWGTGAIVSAGMGAKDRAREAIQLLSPNVARRREYRHSGWRQIDGAWVYLHAGGGMGAEGFVDDVAVRLGNALSRLLLPTPPEGEELRAACRASLAVLTIAPDRITVPLLAAAYRAPLNALRPADMSLFLAGPTGVMKSELAALAQQHYGAEFSRQNLLGNWSSTANALERLAFESKDALCVIDDFAPTGSQQDINRLHATADRVIRGAGNGAGRGRMFADGSLRPDLPPRGFILSTGEDVPRGQSLRARLGIVEIGPGDVDLVALTRAQKDGLDGVYAQAMAGYVQWIAAHMDELKRDARAELNRLRDAARASGPAHTRTPDSIAQLAYGWECWLRYAHACGAITEHERGETWQRIWEALGVMAAAQGEHQRAEEPTRRFLDLVAAAIASQQAHLRHHNSGAPSDAEAWGWRPRTVGGGDNVRTEWNPCGPCVGWMDDDDLYLEPDTAFQLANRIASANGSPLAIAPRTLSKRLHERGLLLARDAGGYTVRRMIEGRKHRVLHLHVGVLSAENPSDPSPNPTKPYGDWQNKGTDRENNPSSTRPATREPVPDPSSDAGTGRIGGRNDPSPSANPSSRNPYQAREKTERTDRTDSSEGYTPPACAVCAESAVSSDAMPDDEDMRWIDAVWGAREVAGDE